MPRPKPPSAKETFGRAFRTVRIAKAKTQEDFVEHSGRTHVSMLERGVNTPTLTTLEGLAAELKIHPMTIAVLTYSTAPTVEAVRKVLDVVAKEVADLGVANFVMPNERGKSPRS